MYSLNSRRDSRHIRLVVSGLLPVLAFGLIASCGGSEAVAPPPIQDFVVSITGQVVAPAHQSLVNGVSYYTCTVAFTVTVTGGTAFDDMAWIDGEIDYRLTSNGTQTSQALSGSALQDWFGSAQFSAGAHRTATRDLGWSGPFTANVLFRFDSFVELQSHLHTITVPVTCS